MKAIRFPFWPHGAAFLVLLGGIPMPASAQEEEAEPRRTVSFRTVLLAGDPSPLYVSHEGDWDPIRLSARRISRPFEGTARGDVLAFARRIEEPDGNTRYLPAARARLPENGREFLLLFTRNADRAYRIAALDRGDLVGKEGTVVFYNLSSHPVVGELSGERFSLDPGDSEMVPQKGNRNQNLSLRLARYRGQEWNLAFSSVWAASRLNMIVFIRDDPDRPDSLIVRRFRDAPIPAPPSP
jgi:hypothetical protein